MNAVARGASLRAGETHGRSDSRSLFDSTMPLRLRLFVKKRGTRRTGTRWFGAVGEAVVDAALLVIGAVGLYWLVAGVLLGEEGSQSWWPWLVMIIPVVLVVYGAVGLVTIAWQNVASSERRAAAVRRATDWELFGVTEKGHPPLPTVPPFDVVTDSPGVRLAYRLPIDAASGWLSFAMAAICLAWNTLVGIFVFQLIRQHAAGEPNWLLTWLMVPFVLAGIGTLIALVRQIVLTTGIGTTRLEISHHPLLPGQTYEAYVWQSGRSKVRWFQVLLVCEERAVYPQGTDTRTATATTFRQALFSERKFDITPQQAFEASFPFTVPAGAMHSFAAPHNEVSWSLVVRGRMARWPEFERRFPVYVYPAPITDQATAQPEPPLAATGQR